MGGNALKVTQVERKPPQEYTVIRDEVLKRLQKEQIYCAVVYELPGKTSFGDLDVLYTTDSRTPVKSLIQQLFPEHSEIVTNGPVTSFDFQRFQIDFILCPEDKFAMSQFYYGYGDTGMILGVILKRFGLSFGIDGLYVHTDDGRVDLSADPASICTFMGLNHQQWCAGFASRDEVFEWIRQTPLYRPWAYQNFSNTTHRHRQQTRPMYNDFFAASIADGQANDDRQVPNGDICTEEFVDRALDHFGKRTVLEEMRRDKQRQRERREKFSGKLLLDLGVPQLNVGVKLQAFKDHHGGQSGLDAWIDAHTADQIRSFVSSWLASSNQQ